MNKGKMVESIMNAGFEVSSTIEEHRERHPNSTRLLLKQKKEVLTSMYHRARRKIAA
jgi:hypothetical protein